SATALTPWMTPKTAGQGGTKSKPLQFGHGTDAVDDPGSIPRTCSTHQVLQFGHGTDAVDDAGGAGPGGRPGPGFKSATALTPWMTWRRRARRRGGIASIRPRH